MAHAKFLIAPAALHVDAPDEKTARSILDDFAAASFLTMGRVRWTAYPKLGPHSRLSFFALIPNPRDENEAVAEIDRICACLVGRDGLSGGDTMDFSTEGGGRHYERIFSRFAGTAHGFFFPRTHWFNIELDFFAPIQKRLRRILRDEHKASPSES